MFSSLGLFANLACPAGAQCLRPSCLYSHRSDLPLPHTLNIPIEQPKATPRPNHVATTIPAKRSATHSPATHFPASSSTAGSSSISSNATEPPRKLQKLGVTQKRVSATSTSYTSTGVPILKVNAAQSFVAIPVRQAMIKNLHDHFSVLYGALLESNPHIAAEHTLRQEEEVYKKSTKLTYRNAVISSISNLKRRTRPDSISHASVGTVDEVAAREESRNKLSSLHLRRENLQHITMSLDVMRDWGYIVDIPAGDGGSEPNRVGHTMKCERCSQPYMVKPYEQTEECDYHWGRQYTKVVEGSDRVRLYTCCLRPVSDGGGCVRGPHIFYENDPEALHLRHAFSSTQPSDASTILDVVAMDCEMVYTTGGFRCARVSVIDGTGAEVFDELVRMDSGVEVVDYNTRFSGITQDNHSKAVLPLSTIRKSLSVLIDSSTIIIGHGLENDLKTLRMIHHQCVDTAILFPHKAGAPYRRSLKDLAKEHLGKVIQAGGPTEGHSSIEDSVATLDIVRWYVLNKPKPKAASTDTVAKARPLFD